MSDNVTITLEQKGKDMKVWNIIEQSKNISQEIYRHKTS